MKNSEILKKSIAYGFNSTTDHFFKLLWYVLAGGFLATLAVFFLGFIIVFFYFVFSKESAFYAAIPICFMMPYFFVKYSSIASQNLFDLYDDKPFRGFSGLSNRPQITYVMLIYSLCIFLWPFFGIGYYFQLRFSLAYYIALDSDLGAIASLKKSWQLTEGKVAVFFLLTILRVFTAFTFVLLIPCNNMIYIYLYRNLEADLALKNNI